MAKIGEKIIGMLLAWGALILLDFFTSENVQLYRNLCLAIIIIIVQTTFDYFRNKTKNGKG